MAWASSPSPCPKGRFSWRRAKFRAVGSRDPPSHSGTLAAPGLLRLNSMDLQKTIMKRIKAYAD